MSIRVYILLDISEDEIDRVVRALRGKAGVRMVDMLDGSPNVMTIIEARERHQLAELTIRAIDSVENAINDLQLIPTRDKCDIGCDMHFFCKTLSYCGK